MFERNDSQYTFKMFRMFVPAKRVVFKSIPLEVLHRQPQICTLQGNEALVHAWLKWLSNKELPMAFTSIGWHSRGKMIFTITAASKM